MNGDEERMFIIESTDNNEWLKWNESPFLSTRSLREDQTRHQRRVCWKNSRFKSKRHSEIREKYSTKFLYFSCCSSAFLHQFSVRFHFRWSSPFIIVVLHSSPSISPPRTSLATLYLGRFSIFWLLSLISVSLCSLCFSSPGISISPHSSGTSTATATVLLDVIHLSPVDRLPLKFVFVFALKNNNANKIMTGQLLLFSFDEFSSPFSFLSASSWSV